MFFFSIEVSVFSLLGVVKAVSSIAYGKYRVLDTPCLWQFSFSSSVIWEFICMWSLVMTRVLFVLCFWAWWLMLNVCLTP